ncbi:hypothetical protein MMC11_002554 [Xylographa trunciseda]|nr:hypothetical protein [Xylographa trunciseda]
MAEDGESVIKIDSIFTTILEAPPSCIEWSKSAPDICVAGTYSLIESEGSDELGQSRSGSLVLFRLDGKSFTGAIEIYHLNSGHNISLERFLIIQAFDAAVLVLALGWHPSAEKSTEFAVSLSNGNIALLDYEKTPSTRVVQEAHSLEAWTVSWSYLDDTSNECLLYSGGDDSGIRAFLPEQLSNRIKDNDDDDRSSMSPIASAWNTKIHGAGVTAILPLMSSKPSTTQTILTGSYDEYIRVLTLNPRGVWKVLAEKRLGGGVWRLKHISNLEDNGIPSPTESSFYVLASCMHAGARVLEICQAGDETWSVKVMYKFEEHESMNYGSDATGLKGQEEGQMPSLLVASTSFYDRKLCLWSIPSLRRLPSTLAVA